MRKELIQKSNYLAQLTNRNKMINLEMSKNIVKR